jgi:GAF domain-containing protein
MNLVCELLEDQIIKHKLSVDIYLGVQHLSEITRQTPRYRALGGVCRRVFVFGIADVDIPNIAGVEFHPIEPNSALAQERFLVVNTPNLWAALLVKEIPSAANNLDEMRRYRGGWFYDEQVVERASLLLSQVLGKFYQPVTERVYELQSMHIVEVNRQLLGQVEDTELLSYRRWLRLTTLNQFAAILLQHQPLQCMMRDAVQILSMIFGAQEAVVAFNMHSGQFMVITNSGDIKSSNQVASLGDGASAQAFRQGKLVIVADVHQDGKIDPLIPKARTILSAPLRGRRKIYGVVTVGSQELDKWNKEDAQTVAAIANMLSVIIEQKVQVSGDVAYQLHQARQYGQALKKLRRPMQRLLELHRELRVDGDFSPTQMETLAQMETLYNGMASIMGFPISLNFTNDSYLPPPPKTTNRPRA